MEYDYIIVGCGLAGIAFAETAINNGKKVFVFDNASQNSSRIAGGLYNPVILKRFTEVWDAKNQLEVQDVFYKNIEAKLTIKLDYKIPLLRKLFSIEEQNNWYAASDKPNLASFLSTPLLFDAVNHINAAYGYGKVNQTGFVDTTSLITNYIEFLKAQNFYSSETFIHAQIEFNNDLLFYNNLQAKQIVFAEGFGMLLNPFFNILPLDGAKGEILLIKAANLKLDKIIKTSIFILPLGNDFYKVGATYNWIDKTQIPTQAAKEELVNELKNVINCDFEIIEHYAGIRPTVKDRKPMLGSHPKFKNVHLLNGLGTRGVMLAPSLAKILFEYIEFGNELPHYVDIKRFKNVYPNLYQSE